MNRNLVSGTLLIIGAGFLVANARMFLDYLKYRRLRRGALLTWPSPRPRNHLLTLVLGVTTAILVVNKLVVARYPFGELMMFLYFGCLTPLTQRMKQGVPQAHGAIAVEPTMDVEHVANAVVYMAGLPLDANVQFMTVMATKMPFVGRG